MTAPVVRFELNPRLPQSRAVRAVALSQIDYALAELVRGDERGVHEARKVCKKLRALLRLIRPFLGEDYRVENERLRNAARALARSREATVLLKTAQKLSASGAADLSSFAGELRRRKRADLSAPLAECERLLRVHRARVAEWPLRRLSAGGLLVGLLTGYRAARRQYGEARRLRTAAALHEWRKQAKYHGYQCSLMVRLWPAAGRRIPRLKNLSDLLGSHHDLFVLSQTLWRRTAEFGGTDRVRAPRRQLASTQRQRVQEALTLGKQLFRDEPMDWFTQAASA